MRGCVCVRWESRSRGSRVGRWGKVRCMGGLVRGDGGTSQLDQNNEVIYLFPVMTSPNCLASGLVYSRPAIMGP